MSSSLWKGWLSIWARGARKLPASPWRCFAVAGVGAVYMVVTNVHACNSRNNPKCAGTTPKQQPSPPELESFNARTQHGVARTTTSNSYPRLEPPRLRLSLPRVDRDSRHGRRFLPVASAWTHMAHRCVHASARKREEERGTIGPLGCALIRGERRGRKSLEAGTTKTVLFYNRMLRLVTSTKKIISFFSS
jgi:hypothetical protein